MYLVQPFSRLAWLTALFASTASAVQPASEERRAIAKDAYIYAFAMLENYNTVYKQAADASAKEYIGGFNRFRHYSEPSTPDNHDVVTPNNDTPYSWAWLDLRAEPIVVSVPAVPKDRYYVLQLVDLFTHNFGYIGVRATGFEAGDYLIAGPKWKGAVPPGVKQAFHAETDLVGVLGRTSLNGPADVPNVQKIQSQFKLTPLSEYLEETAPPAAPAITFPQYDRAKARSRDFIGYLNFLLQFCQPPHPTERALMERFARIGIGPAQPFPAAEVDGALLSAIDAGAKDGQQAIEAKMATTLSSNGIFGSREFLKNDYLIRSVAAAKGLYGNSIKEAWYGGFDGDGRKAATIDFAAGQLPPAKFFWSVTLYALPDRFLYANGLDRYSIGDRTTGLKYGADNSLTLHIGHDFPGDDKESNWLPAPAGPYFLVVRIYGPEPAAIDGSWKLPPLKPVGD